MENFEEILDKAQNGDNEAINELIYEYSTLINGIVFEYGNRVDKDELREFLLFKFIENVKKFKKLK